MRLPLRFLSTHLGTRLGALGLLRGGRLSLHLPLGVLRRGGNISARAVHGVCRRMLLAVIADAHCLAGTLRCRSGPCILQVRGAAGGVTWASQCSSGAQATTEQPVRINRLISICAPVFFLKPWRARADGNIREGCRFRVAV